MKKVLFMALAALVFGMSQSASAKVEIKDMSPGHWAYDAVQNMITRGYMALYEDKSFRGNLPVSREVFAAALSKLIDQVESGEVGVGGGDVGEVRALLNEFKEEISDYESRAQVVGDKIGQIEKNRLITDKSLTETVVETREGFEIAADERGKLGRELSILNDELKSLNADLDKERKSRRTTQTIMWVGIIAAVAVGASSN